MVEKISETVLVEMSDKPHRVRWRGRLYEIEKVGLHHTYRHGNTLYHTYSVATKTLFMKLTLNTDTLVWRLEEIDNGI